MGALSTPCRAQSLERERHFTATIPVWVPGFRGSFAIGDIEVGGESTGGSGGGFLSRFFDSSTSLNFFFMGALSYESGRWRFYADAFGGKFTTDVIFKLTDGTITSASVQPSIVSALAAYELRDRPWGMSEYKRWGAWAYGGMRVYDAELEVDVSGRLRSSNLWVDPFVGLWFPVDLAWRWRVEGWADIGGFRAGSEFVWHLKFLGTFQASELIGIDLGYNFLDIDYRDTVGTQRFRFDARVGGPMLGVGFNF